ncbi:MAG: carboxylating nicotinate-nucleotide diphosphorylase [Desulfitobacteriaceae bacterium]
MFATFQLEEIIDKALQEDLGTGDLSAQVIPGDLVGQAKIYAKDSGVVAGLLVVQQIFQRVNPRIVVNFLCQDGEIVDPGTVVLELEGPLRGILQAERTALNFLQHLSGVATATRRAVDSIRGLSVHITDTRKTMPGLRILQKYAIRVGGGRNHRFGLYDAVMLKDNHLTALGGLRSAVDKVRNQVGHMVKIEVECETMSQVKEAVASGVEVIMLDNMTLEDMREAAAYVNHRAIIEASGGITENNLRQVAETGIDVISLGSLTHSVKVLDFSLDVGQIKPSASARWSKEESGTSDGT